MPIPIPREPDKHVKRLRAEFDDGTYLEAEGPIANKYFRSLSDAFWIKVGKNALGLERPEGG